MLLVGSSSHLRRNCLRAAILAAELVLAAVPLRAAATGTGQGRVMFPNSIHTVSTAGGGTGAAITRTTLTDAESSVVQTVEVALKMHNFEALQARVAAGEQIPRAELASTYFPTQDEENQVVAWLSSEGLTITRVDDDHLAVFAQGTIAQIQQAFGVQFARVSYKGAEYTSAISAPNVRSDIAGLVAGIHGLQQHLRPHHSLSPLASTGSGYLPKQILSAYGGSSLTQTGSGETIAIYALRYPATSDLTAFWKEAGSNATASNVTQVNVAGGPATTKDTADNTAETTLDVEWAGAIAPAAKIRIYAANENDLANNDEIFQQIISDLASYPSIHEVSVSYGVGEVDSDKDYLVIQAQYMATLASSGVTVFAASGDNGNRDGDIPGVGAVTVDSPASDPSVTGVGGTTLVLDSNNNVTTETGWSLSGGGYSSYFARPSWQNFTSSNSSNVASNSLRCVPDVAMVGDPNWGVIVVIGNLNYIYGGTSVGTPVWAGFAALLNQQRTAAGQGSLGLLNPRLYPLNGTSSFRQITSGNNGYAAGAGYNLVTGLGVPVLSNLFAASLASVSAPSITSQLPDPVVTVGQPATLYVNATGQATLAYQWQREAAGATSYSNLSDGTSYSGSTTQMLVSTATAVSNAGDKYQCIVTNTLGTTASTPATLAVNTTGTTTLAGWPMSGGSVNGTLMKARFSWIGGIKYDSSTNTLVVVDSTNCLVRRITLAGVVTTIAGTGSAGTADGTSTAASFNNPGGIAVDTSGNIFVADSLNYTIRKITSAGVVTTIAGTVGKSGHLDGTGTAAQFVDPENLAIDSSGNLYVADGGGYTVRKITSAGVVTTHAGSGAAGHANGQGTAATFGDVIAVAVDSSGNVYVSDASYNQIRKIDTSGNVTLFAGLSSGKAGSSDGTGSAASFDAPGGLNFDSAGNLWVADYYNNLIREITSSGVVTTVAGNLSVADNIDGLPLASAFYEPSEVVPDPYGVLYVADTGNQTVRRIVLSSSQVGPPTITTQPSSATVTAGAGASFSVTATGEGILSYQWTFNGTNISGATSATYSISSTTTSNGGSYAVVVSNSYGSTTSSSATLTVNSSTSSSSGSSSSGGGGGGGGGGGAPSPWFLAALAALAALRLRLRRRTA